VEILKRIIFILLIVVIGPILGLYLAKTIAFQFEANQLCRAKQGIMLIDKNKNQFCYNLIGQKRHEFTL
jgi:hypothetical protein